MTKIDKIKEIINNIKNLDRKWIETYNFGNRLKKDIEEIDKLKQIERKKLEELGIEFRCTDYGSEYCLDLRGLEVVLDAIKED